ncbi:MAG: ATP-binding protein [Myxococcota bacterium]
MIDTDPSRRRRATIIGLAGGIAFFAALPFVVFHLVAGNADMAVALSLGLAGVLSSRTLLRAGHLSWSGHALCGGFYVSTVYVAWMSGGATHAATFWLACIGWLASLVSGRRAAWGWLALVLLAIGGLALVPLLPRIDGPGAFVTSASVSNGLFVGIVGATVLGLDRVIAWLTREGSKAARLADRANRDKDQFLADMSHQLRTPLTAILGYTELLEEDAQAAGNERAERDLGRIGLACRSLVPILDDILDVARVGEPGVMALSPGPIDMRRLEAELRAAIEPLAEAHGNTLTFETEESSFVPILDEGRLRQLLLNLLANACKFTTQGEVTLRLSKGTAGALDFEVEDTGIGMDAEQQSRVFLPFEQATTTIRQAYGGTGLGLTICRRLTDAMGGELAVQSTLGEGTRFYGRLPARRIP